MQLVLGEVLRPLPLFADIAADSGFLSDMISSMFRWLDLLGRQVGEVPPRWYRLVSDLHGCAREPTDCAGHTCSRRKTWLRLISVPRATTGGVMGLVKVLTSENREVGGCQ